jgi:hypothetical protein
MMRPCWDGLTFSDKIFGRGGQNHCAQEPEEADHFAATGLLDLRLLSDMLTRISRRITYRAAFCGSGGAGNRLRASRWRSIWQKPPMSSSVKRKTG